MQKYLFTLIIKLRIFKKEDDFSTKKGSC